MPLSDEPHCECRCHSDPNPFVQASYEDDPCGLCGHGGRPIEPPSNRLTKSPPSARVASRTGGGTSPFVSRCDSISPESLLRCEKPAGHDDGPEPTAHEARRSEHGTAAWGNEPPSTCPGCGEELAGSAWCRSCVRRGLPDRDNEPPSVCPDVPDRFGVVFPDGAWFDCTEGSRLFDQDPEARARMVAAKVQGHAVRIVTKLVPL